MLALGTRTKDDVCQLLHVLTRMIIIDYPSPLQSAPGTARVWHLLQHAMVIIAGMVPVIGDIDQAQPVTIDLAENSLEQCGELCRQGALTRFGHVAQIHGPQTLPSPIRQGTGRRAALT